MVSAVENVKDGKLAIVDTWPRVLLIEDNAGDVVLIKKRMTTFWPKVSIVVVGRLADAYEAYISNQLDLIILDLNLPDGFGYRSVEEALSFVRNVPVVVLTGMESKLTMQEAKKHGATEVIVKSRIMHDDFGKLLSGVLTAHTVKA